MSNNHLDELNSAFDAYDKKKEEKQNEAQKRKTEHEQYLEKFKV